MQTPSAEQRRSFEQAASQYQAALAASTAAQAFLVSRGIGPDGAAMYRLGVVDRPLPGHEHMAGRLSMPYITPAGVVNMRFRCLKPHDHKAEGCPKILPVTGMEQNLYNVGDLKKPTDFICVVEGESDTWTLSALCGLPTVGLPGASAWKKHFPRCLEDFAKVYAFGDGDKAGAAMNDKLIKDVRATPVRLPKGMDASDLYAREGADGLRKLVTQ